MIVDPVPPIPSRVSDSILDITGVTKQYGALRPLRVERLRVAGGEQVALIGFDQPAAEVLINLITGAGLPDSGTVSVFGQPTSAITDSDAWLASLDRFGMVSDRAAFIEAFTVIQNLAMPFTLEIEPPPAEIRVRAEALATEVGLPHDVWDRPLHGLDPPARVRLRLGRALALAPELLLLEHPTATLGRADVVPFGRELRSIAERRQLATVTLTMDREFAAASASRTLTLELATGRLKEGLLARMGFRS